MYRVSKYVWAAVAVHAAVALTCILVNHRRSGRTKERVIVGTVSLQAEMRRRGVPCEMAEEAAGGRLVDDKALYIRTPEGLQDDTTAAYAALHYYRFEERVPRRVDAAWLIPSHPEVDRKGHPFLNTLAVMRVPHLTRDLIQRMRASITTRPTIIVAFETRAMAFAAVLAYDMRCAFVPARKVDDTVGMEVVDGVIDDTQSYRDHSTIAIDGVLFVSGDKVLIVDDVMSSGATVRALKDLIRKCSAEVEIIGELALVNFSEPSKGIISPMLLWSAVSPHEK